MNNRFRHASARLLVLLKKARRSAGLPPLSYRSGTLLLTQLEEVFGWLRIFTSPGPGT